MTPTCKRCDQLPTAPTREYGDTRWPASIADYCIDCVWVIVQEWERMHGPTLITPGPLTNEERERITAEWKKAFTGQLRIEVGPPPTPDPSMDPGKLVGPINAVNPMILAAAAFGWLLAMVALTIWSVSR